MIKSNDKHLIFDSLGFEEDMVENTINYQASPNPVVRYFDRLGWHNTKLMGRAQIVDEIKKTASKELLERNDVNDKVIVSAAYVMVG